MGWTTPFLSFPGPSEFSLDMIAFSRNECRFADSVGLSLTLPGKLFRAPVSVSYAAFFPSIFACVSCFGPRGTSQLFRITFRCATFFSFFLANPILIFALSLLPADGNGPGLLGGGLEGGAVVGVPCAVSAHLTPMRVSLLSLSGNIPLQTFFVELFLPQSITMV